MGMTRTAGHRLVTFSIVSTDRRKFTDGKPTRGLTPSLDVSTDSYDHLHDVYEHERDELFPKCEVSPAIALRSSRTHSNRLGFSFIALGVCDLQRRWTVRKCDKHAGPTDSMCMWDIECKIELSSYPLVWSRGVETPGLRSTGHSHLFLPLGNSTDQM